MVSWSNLSFCQESNIISTEVLKKLSCNSNFSSCLGITFWNTSLDSSNKEVENLWVMENFGSFSANGSKHQISFLVFQRVMKTMQWNSSKTLNKWLGLLVGCVWYRYHWLTSQWVYKLIVFLSPNPFSVNQVHCFIPNR